MRPYQYVTSPADLPKIAEEVLHTDAVALDLETAKIGGGGSTDPLTGRIRLCSLNTGKGRYVIDVYRTGDLGPVAKALSETNAVIVGQNLKFDQKWLLWHYGIELKRVFDTFRASHVLYAGVPRLAHDLWALYKRELNEDPGVEDLAASDWDGALNPKQLDYAADDVDKLLRLREVLRPKLVKENLARIAQIEFQAILPEAAIELNGFYLDAQRWTKRTKMDEARARALAALLHAELPSPHAQLALPGLRASEEFSFNLDSPDQVLQSLRQLGVKQKVKDLETGVSSVVPLVDTKEMTLAMLTGKWPILEKFIDYRGYSKNATAFGTEYLQHIHPTSKRIHCSYFPYTDAGRYACVAPWTPVRTRLGEKPIISVQVGDEVWTHKERWQKVTAFLPQGTQPTYAVRFSNGEVLTCTASHRILLADGSWKTVGEIHSEHIENVGAEPDEPAGGSEAISESGGSTAGGHSAETRDIISQRSSRCEAVLAGSRAQSPSSPTLLSLERGDEEPHVREERGSASQLEGSLRGRSRLSDVPMEREAPLRSSGRDAGSVGTEVAAGRDGCPPHRWGSEKQLLGQSCPSHGTRTPRYSLFAGEGQPFIGIEEIHAAGSIEVYDLTVAEDESYQTYGIFSHNCRSPNLQQIPRGKDFRECFRAEDGRQLAICVADGTRIATDRGLVAIEEVREGDCALLEDGSAAPIRTLIDRGEQPSLLIRTYLGYELVCTPQHRVRVRAEDGAYVWREAGQIRPSDAVAIQSNRGLPTTNADLPPIVLTNVHEKTLTLPTKATAGFAEFCGYLSGDGTFQRNYIGFVVNAEDADVSAILRTHLAHDLQREPPPELSYRGVLDTRVGSLPLLRWCRDNGVSKTQLPPFVWQSTPEVAGAWVRGLFESDGCVSGKSVVLRSVSERLVRETQELLLALGILSQRSMTRHGLPGVGSIWNLRIPTDFLPRFASMVGFMSARKKEKLSALLDRLADSGKSGSIGLPNVRSALAGLQLAPATARLLRNSKHRDKLPSKVAQRLWETDRPTAEQIGVQHMLDGTFFDFAEVERTTTPTHVYDLEVPGPHAYLSAGFVSHNCDWSNIEMRLIAETSGDRRLIQVFTDDKDAHYVTASLMTGKTEKDITKDERQQAKPVNFGFCIAEGQRVLTKQDGLVRIEDIQDRHLVWDGVEWVSHDGLVFMGEREVITYDGLTATPDHMVYTETGERVRFADAASSLRHGRLAVGATSQNPIRYTAFDEQAGAASAQPAIRRSYLLDLSENLLDPRRQHKGEENCELSLPAAQEILRSSLENLGREVRRHGAAVYAHLARLVSSLQGEGNPGFVSLAGTLHSLGAENLSPFGLQGIGIRPDRQQRPLLSPQSAPDDLLGKPLQQGLRRARTYDLINAGPRHRFTVEGHVVSNCYGMSADKLVLYAKSSYGVTLSLSEAKRFRKAFFEGYDGIAAWHRFALDSGKRRGETRTLWGRRRIIKDPKAHNEFYNSPIQGSGADGLKNSLRVVYEKLRKINGDRSPLLAKGALASMVHMVHDEIIVEHVEEPELTKAAQAALHSGMIEGMAPMMGKVPTVAEVGGGPDWSSK